MWRHHARVWKVVVWDLLSSCWPVPCTSLLGNEAYRQHTSKTQVASVWHSPIRSSANRNLTPENTLLRNSPKRSTNHEQQAVLILPVKMQDNVTCCDRIRRLRCDRDSTRKKRAHPGRLVYLYCSERQLFHYHLHRRRRR